MRRPPSRRIRWDLLDLGLGRKGELGRGWSCDWEWLSSDSNRKEETTASATCLSQIALSEEAKKKSRTTFGVNVRQLRKQAKEETQEEQSRRRNTSSPESGDDEGLADDVEHFPDSTQLTESQADAIRKSSNSASLPATPTIASVRIRLLSKGTPYPAARIYRLPTTNHKVAHDTQPGLHRRRILTSLHNPTFQGAAHIDHQHISLPTYTRPLTPPEMALPPPLHFPPPHHPKPRP